MTIRKNFEEARGLEKERKELEHKLMHHRFVQMASWKLKKSKK